ncbi:MAG: type II toxin-antitoxin system RelE/ParE family toxin [Candidatus Aegiribacteria sp.]|nr:type II toxin-antitoxin system RelE/ParE family toxin [Candidatus Aegiribacteria sp.]
MQCEVEYSDEFGEWWNSLSEDEQATVSAYVSLLEERGTTLDYPYSSSVESSRHSHMRELRIQHSGDPYRTLYAFDPRRIAMLLIGGNKTGDDRWYERFVPIADNIYDTHLSELERRN